MLLFDDKFPIKKFIINVVGLNDSDWVKVQPKRNLSDIKKENEFVMLPSNKDITVASIPIEVIRLFKIWGMNGYTTETITTKDKNDKEIKVPKIPLLRDLFREVFGKDEDFIQAKMRGLQNLALYYKRPKGTNYVENIRSSNFEIPKWAIEK